MAQIDALKIAAIALGVTLILAVAVDRLAPSFFVTCAPNTRLLFKRVGVLLVLVVGLLSAMWLSGLTLVPAVMVGAAFAAVSLAMQGILSSVFAGFLILLDHPFELGDEITVGLTTGRVEMIGLRATRLKLESGEVASVPNALLMTTTVIVVHRWNEAP